MPRGLVHTAMQESHHQQQDANFIAEVLEALACHTLNKGCSFMGSPIPQGGALGEGGSSRGRSWGTHGSCASSQARPPAFPPDSGLGLHGRGTTNL